MLKKIHISGFSDEISSDFDTQLKTVKNLGMNYISIRGVNEKNFSEYSIDELNNYIKPKLDEYSIKVSSIGSPIGKVFIDDEKLLKWIKDVEVRNKTFADSRWSDPEGAVLHFDGYIAVVGGYPAQLPHLMAYIANEFFDFLFLHRCHLV